jgi:excisionase family DNA binding protein
MNENTPVLTVNELCERWHCARRTIMDAIHDGKLKAFKVGKRWYRISMDEVKRYESASAA